MRNTAPLEGLIDALGKLSRSDRDQWHLHVAVICKLPRVDVTAAGDCTALMASSAKTFARQMGRAGAVNETELRGIAMSMSVVLANELAAAGGPERPYYSRDNS